MDPIKPGDYTIRTGTRKAPIHSGAVFSSQAIYDHETMKKVREMERESLFILHLNSKNLIIQIEMHSLGTVDSSGAYPREIAKSVILSGAPSIVLVHNHPSGDPEPSTCDKEITRSVCGVMHLIEVKLLDHIILGDKSFYSFADHGFIDEYSAEIGSASWAK